MNEENIVASPEQEQFPKIHLEIGIGEHAEYKYPTGIGYAGETFDGNKMYIGIENFSQSKQTHGPKWYDPDKQIGPWNSEEHTLGPQKALVAEKRPNENITFMHADGEHLPFTDESVDEVLLANVFNSPYVHNKKEILKEIHRVLKDGGVMVVRDDYTPPQGRGFFNNFEDGADEKYDTWGWLKDHGFTMKVVAPTDPEWKEVVQRYENKYEEHDTYFMFATKHSSSAEVAEAA